MNDDGPRRRRRVPQSEPPSGGNWAIIPLGIVVVLAGLGIGKLLSLHFSGKPDSSAMVAQRTVRPTPLPLLTPSAAPVAFQRTPRPSPNPSATHSAPPTPSVLAASSATPKPTPKPAPEPTTRPTSQPTRLATVRPTLRPVIHPTVAPVPKPKSAPEVQAPLGGGTAEQVVRQYLSALVRGDQTSAQALLATGGPTEQSFIDSRSTISSVTASKNSSGTYSVGAEVTSGKGIFYITFEVSQEPNGLLITDHYAIKAQ